MLCCSVPASAFASCNRHIALTSGQCKPTPTQDTSGFEIAAGDSRVSNSDFTPYFGQPKGVRQRMSTAEDEAGCPAGTATLKRQLLQSSTKPAGRSQKQEAEHSAMHAEINLQKSQPLHTKSTNKGNDSKTGCRGLLISKFVMNATEDKDNLHAVCGAVDEAQNVASSPRAATGVDHSRPEMPTPGAGAEKVDLLGKSIHCSLCVIPGTVISTQHSPDHQADLQAAAGTKDEISLMPGLQGVGSRNDGIDAVDSQPCLHSSSCLLTHRPDSLDCTIAAPSSAFQQPMRAQTNSPSLHNQHKVSSGGDQMLNEGVHCCAQNEAPASTKADVFHISAAVTPPQQLEQLPLPPVALNHNENPSMAVDASSPTAQGCQSTLAQVVKKASNACLHAKQKNHEQENSQCMLRQALQVQALAEQVTVPGLAAVVPLDCSKPMPANTLNSGEIDFVSALSEELDDCIIWPTKTSIYF